MNPDFNNATLTLSQVQEIRDLRRAGFRASTLADAYAVCRRTIANIVKGRTWLFLPDVPAPLPLLAADAVSRLRLRCARKLSKSQQRKLADYRMKLAMHHELEAEREGVAVSRLVDWTRKERRAATKQPLSEVTPAPVGGLIF